MRNIFIIESPFQLSNALISHTENDLLIIRMNGEYKNDWQIEKLSTSFRGETYKKVVKKKSKLQLLYFIISTVAPLIIINIRSKIVIGNYNSLWMRFIGCLFSPFSLSVLDDGLITIKIINDLNHRIGKSNIIKQKALKLMAPTFITRYKTSSQFVKIIVQNPCFTANTRKKITAGKVCFIGSPLVEKEVLNHEYYMVFLTKISNRLKSEGYTIEYYPHRAEENTSMLNSLFDKVIVSSDNIESYFLSISELPELFVSFYSSALINLQSNHPECTFISYKIERNEINIKYREEIIEAYNFLSKNDIQVVTL